MNYIDLHFVGRLALFGMVQTEPIINSVKKKEKKFYHDVIERVNNLQSQSGRNENENFSACALYTILCGLVFN